MKFINEARAKKGEDPVDALIEKVYYGEEDSTYPLDIVYRNNFILPNDNGLQYQNFNFVTFCRKLVVTLIF